MRTLLSPGAFVGTVEFSYDGRTIAAGPGDGTVRLWDVAGRDLGSIRVHTATVTTIDFDRNSGRIVTSGVDGSVKVWDIHGEALVTLLGHNDEVPDVAFSPDERYVVSTSIDEMAPPGAVHLQLRPVSLLERRDALGRVPLDQDHLRTPL